MDASAILSELSPPTRDLRRQIPDAWRGFAELHRGALADGALPKRMKELIAVAIAVSKQCDGCIVSHVRGAVRAGATAEEVAEMLGVAVLMNGGPATVYGPRAWDVYLQVVEEEKAKAEQAAGPGQG